MKVKTLAVRVAKSPPPPAAETEHVLLTLRHPFLQSAAASRWPRPHRCAQTRQVYLAEGGAPARRLCVVSLRRLREPDVCVGAAAAVFPRAALLVTPLSRSEAEHAVEPEAQTADQHTEPDKHGARGPRSTSPETDTGSQEPVPLTQVPRCVSVPVCSKRPRVSPVDTPPRPAHDCKRPEKQVSDVCHERERTKQQTV